MTNRNPGTSELYPALDKILAAMVTWLYETAQPDEAIMQHHGTTSPCYGDRRYSVSPTGAEACPVIIVEVADPHPGEGRWRGLDGDVWSDLRWDSLGSERTNPDQCEEIRDAANSLAALGVPVREMWNGARWMTSGSISLARPAHPSLVACVSRYRTGCQEHNGDVFCRCGWFSNGWLRLVMPQWPVAAAVGSAPFPDLARARAEEKDERD